MSGRGQGGRGGGRGRGVVGPARGGLIVGRFVPPEEKDEKDIEAENAKAEREAEKAKRVAAAASAEEGKADINPKFAKLFRGGPRRKEADLPEREDEDEKVVSEKEPLHVESGGVDWLTSLGDSQEQGDAAEHSEPDQPKGDTNEQSSSAPGALDWLKSIGAVGSRQSSRTHVSASAPLVADLAAVMGKQFAEGRSRLSPAVADSIGKPLEVPVFWRTATVSEVEAEMIKSRPSLMEHMKKTHKRALRFENLRGRLKMGRWQRSGTWRP